MKKITIKKLKLKKTTITQLNKAQLKSLIGGSSDGPSGASYSGGSDAVCTYETGEVIH